MRKRKFEEKMTNLQYQKSRGLDKPFNCTPAQARQAWFAMNKAEILKRRAAEKKFGKRRPFEEPVQEVF